MELPISAARDAKSDLPTARAVDPSASGRVGLTFTIATLVTDDAQYDAMRASFAEGGFRGDDCEYVFIDNRPTSGAAGKADAYRGPNAMLQAARAEFVILCHQDVRLLV